MQTVNLLSKTKGSLAAILLLLSVMAHLSLHAQVTVGGVDNPRAGAILDLNSSIKGGLLLSNVELNDLDTIPSSFPNVTGTDVALLKNGLKGAMIYNTNPNTCPGVHVWTGNYWERITSMPVKVPETTLTSPNAANIFGGGTVNFTASFPGAKTYRWYVSEISDDYGHPVDITTTPSYSKVFSVGKSYKVKVVMDDCRSLIESNELSFEPARVSPYFGTLDGGNVIYVYGNFQYAASSDYVQDGLVAHYDGINNQGPGDKYHNNMATSWKDLTGHGYDGTLYGGAWTGNSLVFDGIDDYVFLPDALDVQLPATAEAVTKTTTSYNGIMFYDKNQHISFGYYNNIGRFVVGGGETGTGLYHPTYDISGSFNNAITTLSMRFGTNFPSEIRLNMNGMAIPPDNNVKNGWGPGAKHSNIGRRDASEGPYSPFPFSGSIFCLRIYNRQLSDDELAKNADLDQKRYLAPPKVTVDGKDCSDVVVLSPYFLMCKVPAGSTAKDVEVKVNNVSYGQVYKYVHPQTDFYISTILPIIGSASQTLEFTGNRLDDISEIRVGNARCENLTKTSTSCNCTLPYNPPGEVDITIVTVNETYFFAKVFEYK